MTLSMIRGVPAAWVVCAGLFLVAMGPRLGHLLSTLDYMPIKDGKVYDYLAMRIIAGGPYDSGPVHNVQAHSGTTPFQPSAYRTPGLPLVLALVYSIFGHDYVAARTLMAVLNSVAAPMLFTLGRDLFGSPAGLVAGLLWAFWPMSIYFSYASDTLFAEPLAIPLMVFAVWTLVRGVRLRATGWFAVSGLMVGLAALTRGYLLPAVVVAVATGVAFAAARRSPWRGVFALALGASCAVGPWLVRNYLVFDALVFSTNVDNLWLGNNEWARGSSAGEWRRRETSQQWAYILSKYPGFVQLSELEKSRIYVKEAREVIFRNPARTLWLMMRKAMVFFQPFYEGSGGALHYNFSFVFMVPLFLVGTAVVFRRSPADAWLVFFPIISLFVALLITVAGDRYRSPAEPFMIVFSGVAVVWLARQLGRLQAIALCGGWLAVNLAAAVFSDRVVMFIRSAL